MKKSSRKRTPQQTVFALKVGVSVVCCLILLFLFTLGNRSIATTLKSWRSHLPSLPKFSISLPASGDSSSADETVSSQAGSITFDSDTLTYDGSAALDLTADVHVLNSSGEELEDAELSTALSDGENGNEKLVTYTATVDGEELSATRTLTLENYEAPSIQTDDTLEGLTSDNADEILSEWIDSGAVTAEDGLGNDCSDDITATCEADESDPLTYHYTFTVTNLLGDQATAEADVQMTLTKPLILLNTDEVTLQVGERFSYGDYVQLCIDAEGNSVGNHIVLSSRPDTDTPGTYEITYTVYDDDGVYSDPATLKVIVEESSDEED